jgi:cyclopropane-fatty-acyl-phospholipid synthase
VERADRQTGALISAEEAFLRGELDIEGDMMAAIPPAPPRLRREILDVQSLRAHYALALAAWVTRLEADEAEAVTAAGEEVARTWWLYMSAARLGFERGDLDVCQLLLAKPADGRPAETPLRPWC